MRIAVFGAGAIGGLLAVKLHQAGAQVTVIARGPHLAAMRERGLTLKSEGQAVTVRIPCTDDAAQAGPQDYVIATLKATGLAPAATGIAKLMGPQTALVTGINGIPYWYFYGQESPWRDRTLESVDPGGELWRTLPPHPRFAGCVGIAAGPEVAIMDEAGALLPAGALGEIVIRGRNVTQGYEANPEANAKAFTHGWFRTGDQGVIDDKGYLRLTGRLKELINRGGEKISPLEVDTVIMDHPAVAQVVTFGMPHDKLGEDVAAAVVLREGAACDERELRAFVSARMADFKVPRKIVFLTEIPKGATGKLQRIGLAEKLGMTG